MVPRYARPVQRDLGQYRQQHSESPYHHTLTQYQTWQPLQGGARAGGPIATAYVSTEVAHVRVGPRAAASLSTGHCTESA
eukprot:3941001-Rhodomonas_salina.3